MVAGAIPQTYDTHLADAVRQARPINRCWYHRCEDGESVTHLHTSNLAASCTGGGAARERMSGAVLFRVIRPSDDGHQQRFACIAPASRARSEQSSDTCAKRPGAMQQTTDYAPQAHL